MDQPYYDDDIFFQSENQQSVYKKEEKNDDSEKNSERKYHPNSVSNHKNRYKNAIKKMMPEVSVI